MADAALLTVEHVSHTFGRGAEATPVLRDVNLTVAPGEFVCLIGPSGCGKSTLLRALAGLLPMGEGTITWSSPPKLAMVFQSFALFPWRQVQDNIGFGLDMAGVSPSTRGKRVAAAIRQMKLEGFAARYPKELSGGMKQRVGIARALAIEPDVLLTDEPFSALDALTATTLRQDLLQVWKERKLTVVMVTHLVEEAVLLADRIAVFSARPGTIKEIITNDLPRPRNPRTMPFYALVDRIQGMIESKPQDADRSR